MSNSPDDHQAREMRVQENVTISSATGGSHSLLDDTMDKEAKQKFRDNLDGRGNAPSLAGHLIVATMPSAYFETSETLWTVDRIIETQTVNQFLNALQLGLSLPDGKAFGQNIDGDDLSLLFHPYTEWAPPPFNITESVPSDTISYVVGSMDERGKRRLKSISKELYALKVRLWEGIMPLSARRWREKRLYDLNNFSTACRILSMTITVFRYLNYDTVQPILREMFILIHDELSAFEEAINAKNVLENKPIMHISTLWYQFIRAKYGVMVNRTYSWVMNHVAHMKKVLLVEAERLAALEAKNPELVNDEERLKIVDMWQDICEIASHADYTILLPMDGYDGSDIRWENPDNYNATTHPLRISPSLKQRHFDYHARQGHFLAEATAEVVTEGMNQLRVSESQMGKSLTLMRKQDIAQKQASAELRGEPVSYDKEPWVANIRNIDEWGFVVYRACHSCSDAEWDEFRARFDADQADWGSELVGVGWLRERSELHWLDTRDLEIDDDDVEALKRSFKEFTKTDNFPYGFTSNAFLVVDDACLSSYLTPRAESSPPGDSGGFITVIDADFDHSKGPDRPEEAPKYTGRFRVLSSLLWDDLSALFASNCQDPEKTWPLVMNHPSHLYVGPIVQVNQQAIVP